MNLGIGMPTLGGELYIREQTCRASIGKRSAWNRTISGRGELDHGSINAGKETVTAISALLISTVLNLLQ